MRDYILSELEDADDHGLTVSELLILLQPYFEPDVIEETDLIDELEELIEEEVISFDGYVYMIGDSDV